MSEIHAKNYFEKSENVHIHQYNETAKEYLFVVVLTSTQQYWQGVAENTANIPLGNYGANLQSWKPYQTTTVYDLLEEFSKESKINLQVCYSSFAPFFLK